MSSNVFERMGKASLMIRAIFEGTDFPITDLFDLIDKAGGKSRIIRVPNPDGTIDIFSLLDILEAAPYVKSVFPLKSKEDFVNKFMILEQDRRKKKLTSPLLKISNKNLLNLYKSKCVEFRIKQKPFFINTFSSSHPLLLFADGFKSKKSLALLHEGKFKDWAEVVIEHWLSLSKQRALSEAASAKANASRVATLRAQAENAVRDVASSSTNAQVQQKVNQACNFASQAIDLAQDVVTSASAACANAASIPHDVEAQTACSEAQAASASAQADAFSAQQACFLAQDIASISIVTICGKVIEEDPCCDDAWSGTNIEVIYPAYPEIPAGTDTTDSNGNYCITGRFGHSSRIGCSRVIISMNATDVGVQQTKEISICGNSVPNVNFKFDAPGNE